MLINETRYPLVIRTVPYGRQQSSLLTVPSGMVVLQNFALVKPAASNTAPNRSASVKSELKNPVAGATQTPQRGVHFLPIPEVSSDCT